jgi:cytochrome P450
MTIDQVPALRCIDRLLNEVTRTHAATFLIRRTTNDVDLGGFALPAGTEVGYSIHSIQHDIRYYTDPDRFDPDRWLPDRPQTAKEAFIPFSAGGAKCVGDAFAWTEMKIVLATLLACWKLDLDPAYKLRETLATIPRPANLMMTPTRLDRV